FAVLAGGPQAGTLGRALATRIVALFDTPFLADGQEVRLSASVGLALYPQQAGNAAELLRKSDMAMYTRKRSGRNGAHVFDPTMLDDTIHRSEIES
ncbi:MAG: diguanylate cyclase, partial [Afipia sp.]|nr:diguanylate cyclase [Afipia sp.]